MPVTGVKSLREVRVEGGAVPRFEVPGWREQYGLVAGITGRGESGGAGFDLGLWGSPPVGEVMSRWQEFREAEGCLRATALGLQIHGSRVTWHDSAFGWTILDGVDGHATGLAGLMLTVTVADCIPVYLAAPRHGGLALLHAGWRGTAAKIVECGVEVLSTKLRCEPYDIVMHCGVGISGDEYEVNSEVFEALGRPLPAGGKGGLDLREVLAEQGRGLGITDISVSEWCSSKDSQHFFSHRRSGGKDGRMAAYLGALLS